jgi:hypothetical protein
MRDLIAAANWDEALSLWRGYQELEQQYASELR